MEKSSQGLRHFCGKRAQYPMCIWCPGAPLELVVLFHSTHGQEEEEETGVHTERGGGDGRKHDKGHTGGSFVLADMERGFKV